MDLVSRDKKVEAINRFIRWCFPSEEEVRTFKKELAFSYEGICKCVDLVKEDQLELVDEFINLCLSSKEKIRELKKDVAYRIGSSFCERLISDYSVEDIYDERGYYVIGRTTKFNGGKWEQVEKFLTWCFSSEDEISEFKKIRLLEVSGKEIHFDLIRANQWGEAETFFSWLGLSSDEIKKTEERHSF